MAKQRYFTEQDVRTELSKRIKGRTQREVAGEADIKFQNLSIQINGAPIGGKLLAWLGFERSNVYEKTKP